MLNEKETAIQVIYRHTSQKTYIAFFTLQEQNHIYICNYIKTTKPSTWMFAQVDNVIFMVSCVWAEDVAL